MYRTRYLLRSQIESGQEYEPEDPEELISEWEMRLWRFRRAVEIIFFDDYDEELDGDEFKGVRDNPPYEYVLWAQGEFEGIRRSQLPYTHALALDIIRQIEQKQRDNELATQELRS